eukprot:COSAG01_NODE_480_length_16473_cov_655.154208_11_plen_58_part_00
MELELNVDRGTLSVSVNGERPMREVFRGMSTTPDEDDGGANSPSPKGRPEARPLSER